MPAFYLIPFVYFARTRLATGTVMFHGVFEWAAAVVLVAAVGKDNFGTSLTIAVATYVAFISVYEIGYIANDFFSASRETDARMRGPANTPRYWVAAWCFCRVAVFCVVTILLDMVNSPQWWSLFAALALVFAAHNLLLDREFKTGTFAWLALFRFMAPVMFAVQQDQLLGIALAAAMTYVPFRYLGYLDSKGLLCMPGRKRTAFRVIFFCIPLAGVLALWSYPGARGFVVLILSFSVASLLGTANECLRRAVLKR